MFLEFILSSVLGFIALLTYFGALFFAFMSFIRPEWLSPLQLSPFFTAIFVYLHQNAVGTATMLGVISLCSWLMFYASQSETRSHLRRHGNK